ncbi:MAG: HAD family hydrolase, partial [Clostridium sp.]
MYWTKNVINKIRNYKYVSFDIFDTLILRNVLNPNDIFKIIQNKINKNDFYTKRINAEKEAVRKSLREEITLEEIYSNITELKSDNEKEYVMDLEKQTEIKYSVFNPIFKEIIDYCRKNHKKIIIASDMYLDESTIKSILKKNGVEYDYLYLSSKIKLRKSRGKMYTYILKDLGISKNELVHIGDNKLSDYIIPKLMGIKSILYTRSKDKCICVNDIADNICFSFIRNIIMPENNKYYNFGFKYLGMLIYGMCQWIHEEAERRNINSIYFIARDGFILKKAYDLIYKNEQTKYLYLSRRSLTVPMLRDVQSMKDILDKIPYIKRTETMDSFMHKLGIEDKSLISRLKNK